MVSTTAGESNSNRRASETTNSRQISLLQPLHKVFLGSVFPFPPLAAFADALIDGYLDAPTNRYVQHVIMHIAYLRKYNAEAKIPGFGKLLHPSHRPFLERTYRVDHRGTVPGDRERQKKERDTCLNDLKEKNLRLTSD
jgi:hypothetical protein